MPSPRILPKGLTGSEHLLGTHCETPLPCRWRRTNENYPRGRVIVRNQLIAPRAGQRLRGTGRCTSTFSPLPHIENQWGSKPNTPTGYWPVLSSPIKGRLGKPNVSVLCRNL